MTTNFWNPKRAQQIAEREKIDAFIACSATNVAYATGFWSAGGYLGTEPCFAVMPVDKPEVRALVIFMGPLDQVSDLKLSGVEVNTFGHFYWHKEPDVTLTSGDEFVYKESANPRPTVTDIDALIETIHKYHLEKKTLAVEELGMNPFQFQTLQAALPDAKLVRGYKLFREMRTIKTPEEVERIRTVVAITERAIHTTHKAIHEGISELEVSRILTSEMCKEDGRPVLLTVGFGEKSAHPNSLPTERKLRKGDIIRFDVGARRLLYHSDLARIATLGEAPIKVAQYYNAVLEGQKAALAMIKPGVVVNEAFMAGMQAARNAGIPHYRRNHIGHGLGAEFYDEPLVSETNTSVFEEGMVLNIETPYYELGFGGVQTEDTILVTKDGYQFLTSGERPLYQL